MDVLAEHGRRGIGGRLLETVCTSAREHGYAAVTLSTFRDVPWNDPFCRRHGFVDLRLPRGRRACAQSASKRAATGCAPMRGCSCDATRPEPVDVGRLKSALRPPHRSTRQFLVDGQRPARHLLHGEPDVAAGAAVVAREARIVPPRHCWPWRDSPPRRWTGRRGRPRAPLHARPPAAGA
jgi:hypothetical protein